MCEAEACRFRVDSTVLSCSPEVQLRHTRQSLECVGASSPNFVGVPGTGMETCSTLDASSDELVSALHNGHTDRSAIEFLVW